MKIVANGPRSKTNAKEMVTFVASTAEDAVSLRVLYDLLHKFGSTEVLISLAESTLLEDKVQHMSLVFE